VSLAAKYTTTIVVAHLLVNIAHGLAHRELRIGLDPTSLNVRDRCGAGLPFARNGARLDSEETTRTHSLVAFDVRIVAIRLVPSFSSRQPRSRVLAARESMGITFVLTAYGLLIMEGIGAYVGVHFLWIARETSSKTVKT